MYKKKYYYNFRGTDNSTNTVEIWWDTETAVTAEEIEGLLNPFVIELPQIEDKFQTIRGTGCELNILSTSNMKFLNSLYHVNPKEYMIKHYWKGSLNWIGYMNSETFTETYAENSNYPVQLTGNDGFALMDRFYFWDSVNKLNYTGIKSQYEIIKLVFQALGLPFNELKIALSTTFNGYNGTASETILHKTFIDCSNFVDEEDTPMTLRGVLEAILKPYGAFILQDGTNIVITDINSIWSSITYKHYSMTTWLYTTTSTVANNNVNIDGSKYMTTGQTIEVSGGFNKQVVTYSPYIRETIIENSIADTSEFTTVPSTWTLNGYFYRALSGNTYWNTFSTATFEQSYWSYNMQEKDSNIYLKALTQTGRTKIAELKLNPFINLSNGGERPIAIKLDGSVLPKTKSNPYDSDSTGSTVIALTLTFKLRVGSKYVLSTYAGFGYTYSWTTDSNSYLFVDVYNGSNQFENTFQALGLQGDGVIIPIDANFSDNIYLEIYSDFSWRKDKSTSYTNNTSSLVSELWFKNLSISIADYETGSTINTSDVEYIGFLDDNFANKGNDITLYCGTDTYGSDKAKLMYLDGTEYRSIKQWSRGTNLNYKIEELLLGSLSSNFKSGYYTLSNMNLLNDFNILNLITDTAYLPNRKFMLAAYTNNYYDATINCTLQEVSNDNLIIQK